VTIKELAEFTGKTERTIQNWVKKSNEVFSLDSEKISLVKGQETHLTIDQVESVLRSGSMSKDAVSILMKNARQETTGIAPIDNQMEMFKMMSNVMAQSIATALKPLVDRLDSLESKEPKQLALPSAPDIEPRPYLNQLVREYAQLKDVPFPKAWNVLYDQFLYRCHENIKVKAKNEGIKPIDYMDRENKLLTACSIMKELING